ncbi:MAG: ABC transporter permease [Anaerolinea sp.]|nr:ABC transporter permease [Anaerolinea sp.]
MNKVIQIALNDLRLMFKERDIWINLVLIPLVLSYVVGIANGALSAGASQTIPTFVIDVIDSDNSALSAQFLADLRAANESFVLCPADQTDEDACRLGDADFTPELAQTRLEDKTSLALIEIPAGFESLLNAGEDVSIIYRSNETAAAPSYILQTVQGVVGRAGGAINAARVGAQVAADFDPLFAEPEAGAAFSAEVRERAGALWASEPISITYVLAETSSQRQIDQRQSGFGQSVPGMASMYVMFAVFPAATAFLLERKQWTLQRVVTMPVSRAQILGGKLLARFIIGMIQYTIVFAFGLFLGVNYGNDYVALVALMVSFVLCITALTIAITTMLKNVMQANGITLLLTLTLAPLGGAWWSLEIVPAWMRTLGHISPVAWVMDGYNSLLFFGGNLGTVITPILVLLGAAAVLFAFGVSRFRFD